MTLTEIKSLLRIHELNPLRRFGQNFLHDQNLAKGIVEASVGGFGPEELVLEIGPGLGAITEFFIASGRPVTVIEIDQGLSRILQDRFSHVAGFTLIEADALKVDHGLLPPAKIVAGNLPYYISTPLLARWMELPVPPQRMVFTLQREVCERLAAKPGTKVYGALSVLVQTSYDVELLRMLPPEVFYPRPEVDSAVVRLERKLTQVIPSEKLNLFREFVRRGFSQRRKKLSNTLGIPDGRRAEEVPIQEWPLLWKASQ